MTRGILSTSHVRPTRPVTQAELDELYRGRLRRRAVRDRRRDAAGDEARHRQQRGPDPCPPRRADRADHRHRRRGQPRQGRRRPGRPVVQPRPRPAGDDRPPAAAAGAHDDRADRVPGPARRPTGSRRSSDGPPCPPGFRAGGLVAGIKASGRPDLGRRRHDGRAGRRGRRLHPERVRGRARPPVAGAPRGRRAIRGAGSAGPRRSSRRAARANAATGAAGDADQRAIAALLAEAIGTSDELTLHLSTGVIGTRLPLDRVAAGIALDRADARGDATPGSRPLAIALRTTDSVTKVATTTDRAARRRRPARDGDGQRRSPRASG